MNIHFKWRKSALNNAAFKDDPGEKLRIEQEVLKKFEDGHTEGPLVDINGNKCGDWYLTPRRKRGAK